MSINRHQCLFVSYMTRGMRPSMYAPHVEELL